MTTLRDRETSAILERGETQFDNNTYFWADFHGVALGLYTLKVKASAQLVKHCFLDCLLQKATKIVGCSPHNSIVRNQWRDEVPDTLQRSETLLLLKHTESLRIIIGLSSVLLGPNMTLMCEIVTQPLQKQHL